KKNPPAKITKLEKELNKLSKEAGLKKVELVFDEEHNTWEVHFTDSQGAERILNWEMAHTPEYRQMMSKYKQIESFMQPPFVIERAARGAEEVASAAEEQEAGASEAVESKTKKAVPAPKAGKRKSEAEVVEKTSARELFDYVVNEGR